MRKNSRASGASFLARQNCSIIGVSFFAEPGRRTVRFWDTILELRGMRAV